MEEKHIEESILQIIDQLRLRKARPDLMRICHMASRRLGLKHLDTEALLDKFVESGVVVKVDYKNNISYRNAAKWKKKPFGRNISNSEKISNVIWEGVKVLGEESDEGVQLKNLEKWISKVSDHLFAEKSQLVIALRNEMDTGRIKKLPNGNYTLGTQEEKSAPVKKKSTPGTATAAASASNAMKSEKEPSPSPKRGRPPSKRKKFKKNHGPDFEIPSSLRKLGGITSDDEEDAPVCDYCLKSSSRRSANEGLLTCKECKATAHPSCMGYSEILAERAMKSPWQCIDCKTCYVCDDSGEPEMMLFCDACDKGYHMSCHEPALNGKPTGKWVCSQCDGSNSDDGKSDAGLESFLDESQGDGASCLPTPCDSPISDNEEDERNEPPTKKKRMEPRKKSFGVDNKRFFKPEIRNGRYPDASNWKVEEVAKFFLNLGFKDQAQALREQEIDGQSLLLMKRTDVLTGLNIKLGPALKIYQHVMKLQTAGVEFEDHLC